MKYYISQDIANNNNEPTVFTIEDGMVLIINTPKGKSFFENFKDLLELYKTYPITYKMYSKTEIENRLKELLHEMLRGYNQEDSIISLEYDEEKNECNLKLTVNIVEEDDYVGFGGY